MEDMEIKQEPDDYEEPKFVVDYVAADINISNNLIKTEEDKAITAVKDFRPPRQRINRTKLLELIKFINDTSKGSGNKTKHNIKKRKVEAGVISTIEEEEEDECEPVIKSEPNVSQSLDINNSDDVVLLGAAINLDKTLIKCRHCEISLNCSVKLYLHESRHCERCSKLFVSKKDVEVHMPKHCRFRGCLDIIEDESNRTKHMKSHSNDWKPFQCDNCKRRYKHYLTKRKHMTTCKDRVKIKCLHCSFKAFSKNKVKGHVFRRHTTGSMS